jgi:hypothetical protein
VAKDKKSKFPENICVVVDPDSGADPYYLANTSVEASIDEDGPTDIAEYKLVRVRKFRKDAVEC